MNIALVCIAKNEDHYIDEWIQYHIKLGFSKIFIYQNDWRYSGTHINDNHVQLIEHDGALQQLPAYNDFIQNHYQEFDWAGFIDVDEFIVLKHYSNISDFLENYNDYEALGMNWSMFGSNDMVFKREYSVIKRFTKCRKQLVEQIKCFINFNKAKNTLDFHNSPHNISQINKTISVDKSHFINNYCDWNNANNRDIAYINHYYTKTKQEWNEKMARGWPCDMNGVVPKNYKFILWANRNTIEYNEFEDLTAYNFFFDIK